MADPALAKVLSGAPADVLKEFAPLFKATWWFWLIIFIVWIIKEIGPDILKKIKINRKLTSLDRFTLDRQKLRQLRNLSPLEFEDYIANLYSKLGYNTKRVGRSHDGGIDVEAEKDGVKHYIQCKKFITSRVRVGAVRDFYGAMTNGLANGKGIFITTNVFTSEAEKFAEENPIELIDGFGLLRLIKLADDKNSNNTTIIPEAKSLPSEIIRKCPICGGNLVKRQGKYGEFLGCSNFPKCNHIQKI